jgi:ATP-dependent helicase HrpB
MTRKLRLPVDSLLPDIIASLRHSPNLVIVAPPGAGKTTRVPPALLDAGLAGHGEVWVLEPRRLAARMSARRVAEERQEKPGETVGYQVRFEEVSGPRTRLRFLTEGVLTRRLLSDPHLNEVGVVVLDEFHERHLPADLALALLRRLQRTVRPDLKLVAMSATLAADPIAEFLGHCPILHSEGRRFEVAIEHAASHDNRPLHEQTAAALRRLIAEGLEGDVLVFLPGAAEIRRAQAACERIAAEAGLLVLPLHGELPAAAQDRAVSPASQRKVVLSTNVAETSITIDGVVAVIDSGLARVASHSPWSGLPVLNVSRISRASAVQRAGRAGRTRPGRCLRLYTAQDFAARPAHDTPEIQRLDLAEPVLELHAAGITEPSSFEWFEAPSVHSLEAADKLLRQLGAIDRAGQITETGRLMLPFPLHPRQSRLLVEAERRGTGDDACVIAALIGERDIRQTSILSDRRDERSGEATVTGPSDLLYLLDLFAEAEAAKFAPERLRAMKLDPGAVMAVDRVSRQLRRMLNKRPAARVHSDPQADEALLISILTGYPDRVARRRRKNEAELLLSGGGAAALSPASVVRKAEFVVAVEIEERRQQRQGNRNGTPLIRLASQIEPEWLLDLYSDALSETKELCWNAQVERVEATSRLWYGQVLIDESRSVTAEPDNAARVLAEAALNAGLRAFSDEAELSRFLARVEFVARTFPEAGLPELTEADARAALAELCTGRRSFAELREAVRRGELVSLLQARLTAEQTALLARMAPERTSLAGRRNVRINYEAGRPPWIESRLQDFFGMTAGPTVAGGRVPLVLHLLAPNHRPVQVTTDLAGFWQRIYPQTRRELSRRYPRHQWPEDPLKSQGKSSRE